MAHEMTIHLTDDEYNALTTRAKQTGQQAEVLIQNLLNEVLIRQAQLPRKPGRLLSREELLEYLYDEGVIESIPTGEPPSEEEEAELERLGNLFGQGKPLSEMIIEDRGPY